MKAVICHSGGMDSSLCLRLAIERHGASEVLSLGFDYGQRHHSELEAAAFIAASWGVQRKVIPIPILSMASNNALVDTSQVLHKNTLVPGRNGLMAWHAALLAHALGASEVWLGVLELENSNYRDCSRGYMDLVEKILTIDLKDPHFALITPLVAMTKRETLELAESLGIFHFLLENTITCYQGFKGEGCKSCPACLLRNRSLDEHLAIIQ